MAFTRTSKAPVSYNMAPVDFAVYDYNGFPIYDKNRNLIWNTHTQTLERGISDKGHHLWYVGPNPFDRMVTFQANGVRPALKKGGKMLKRLIKNK